MADEGSDVQSSKVLIIALVIGALVAIVYNMHIHSVRKQSQPKMARVLCFKRDMDAGDRIRQDKDIAVMEVPESVLDRLRGVVSQEALAQVERVGLLNRNVYKGQLVFWDHVIADDQNDPARRITVGKQEFIVPLDPRRVPGQNLRPASRVTLLGVFSVGRREPYRTYPIVQGVPVLSVGGVGAKATPGSRGRSRSTALRSYHSISVEVDPDVYVKLNNLVTHARGQKFLVALLNPNDPIIRKGGKINPKLAGLAETAGEAPSEQ